MSNRNMFEQDIVVLDHTELINEKILSSDDLKRLFPRQWISSEDISDIKRRKLLNETAKVIIENAKKRHKARDWAITVPFYNALSVYAKNSYRQMLWLKHEGSHLLDLMKLSYLNRDIIFHYTALNPFSSKSRRKTAYNLLLYGSDMIASHPYFEFQGTWRTEYETCLRSAKSGNQHAIERKKELDKVHSLPLNQCTWPYIDAWKMRRIMNKLKLDIRRIDKESESYVATTQKGSFLPYTMIEPHTVIDAIIRNAEKIKDGILSLEEAIKSGVYTDFLVETSGKSLSSSRIERMGHFSFFRQMWQKKTSSLASIGTFPSVIWACLNAAKTVVFLKFDGTNTEIEIGVPSDVELRFIKTLIAVKILGLFTYQRIMQCLELDFDELAHTSSAFGIDIKIPTLNIQVDKLGSLIDSPEFDMFRLRVVDEVEGLWKDKHSKKLLEKWMINNGISAG